MRKTIIYFELTFLLVLSGNAQENQVIQDRKIYKQIMGQELAVDVFYSNETLEGKDNPAIAFFHGGGWSSGSPAEFHNACRRYARKGFVCFSLGICESFRLE